MDLYFSETQIWKIYAVEPGNYIWATVLVS
jgi:hypothetical protein